MDSALKLRQLYDRNDLPSSDVIESMLSESKIIEKLTSDYEDSNLFNIFRIICLSEIPFVERLEYTQKLISYIKTNVSTPEGFSYTGKINDVVPCYNAMLLEAFTRLGLSQSTDVQNALNWIIKYQVFERNESTDWQYDGIHKFGGCMKKTPCYIGIGKTVRALITYAEYTKHENEEVEKLINKGVSYMLKHNMFQRLSNQKPISAHITHIMFPQAYMLSLSDLVYIANKRNLWEKDQLNPLKELLKSKETSPNNWKIDYIYSHKGFKSFESRRKESEWIHYMFAQ